MGEPATSTSGSAEQRYPLTIHADAAPDETSRLRNLFAAVLEQALDDLERYRDSRDPWLHRLHRDALAWVDCADRRHAFTFVNVCEALGYEPSAVRRRLLVRPAPDPAEGTDRR